MGYVFVGFFFPDPLAENVWWALQGRRASGALWGFRLGVPLLAAGVLYLYYGVTTKKISAANLLLLIGGTGLALLLIYPFARHYYDSRFQSVRYQFGVDRFNSFLQVDPSEFQPRGGDRADTLVVMALGGSTTEFTDRAGHGWPYRLEQRLQGTMPGKTIEVHNLGQSWYTTLHTLVNYEANLRFHRPDAIIVMHAVNDLYLNADFSYFSGGEIRSDYGSYYGAIRRIIGRQGFAEYVRRQAGVFWYHEPREVLHETEFPGLVFFERNLQTLLDLAKIDGTTVVLVTQPYLYKESMSPEETSVLSTLNRLGIGPSARWSLAVARTGMERYNESTRELARDNDAILIDLEKAVPKTLQYFLDDVHYADETFDLIAAHMAGDLATAFASASRMP